MRDGKSSKDKDYSLRDWFKGGGWKQTGGKYDGKPCAKQPGQTTKPYCRDADDRAAMSKDERDKRAAKKRKEDPNPDRKGKAKIVTQDSFSNWHQELQLDEGLPDPKVNWKKDMDPYDPRKASRDHAPGSPLPPADTRPGLPDMRLKKAKAKDDKKVQTDGYETEGDLVDEGKKDACYKKVKASAKVWPSAYASGRLVQCRKKGAANYGNKSEEMDYASFADRAKKTLEKNKKKTLKGETKTTKEEWIVDNAAQYFFNEGINEEGLVIFIEELGVENFVEFVHDLAEDSELIEAYALTGKKKTTKRLPKGTQPAKTTKATIARGDRTIKAASPSGAFKKRPAVAKAVETAKEKQPEKKPVKSTLAKSVADTLARGALSAWQGHKAAMKKKKEGGSVASQIGAGLGAATGAMLKKGKKHLSDDYDYSNWRDEFKAMEYEFIDIIKPEPLVTEASFEIKHTSADVRKAEKQKKIDALTQKGSTEGERRAAARKAGTSLPSFKTEEVDKRRAPKELLDRLNSRMVGWMADDGPNKPAYDAKQRLLAKAKAKRMGEEVESIDELKCWKGYKRKKGAVPGAKGSCVKESEQIDEIAPVVAGVAGRLAAGAVTRGIGSLATSSLKRKLVQKVGQKVGDTVSNRLSSEEFVDEAKDETEIGITGQPIPKRKRSPKKQYEFEKKRRENLGRNVGGKTYSADVAPYKTNPRVGYLRNEYEMENELGEAKHTPTKSDLEANIGGGNLQKLSKKASKRIDYDVDGDVDPQDKVEKSKGDYGEELPTPFGKFRTGDSKKVKVKKEEVSNWRDELSEESTKKYCPKCKKIETKSQCAYGPKYWEDNAEEIENGGESGGVSEGAAWTKKSGKSESGGLNEKGRKSYERQNPGSDLKAPSKKVGNPRRKSFCARMKGMKKKLTSSKTANDPDSRINKSLRAWNC